MGVKTNCVWYVDPEEVIEKFKDQGEMVYAHRCSNPHKPMNEERCPDDCECFKPKL